MRTTDAPASQCSTCWYVECSFKSDNMTECERYREKEDNMANEIVNPQITDAVTQTNGPRCANCGKPVMEGKTLCPGCMGGVEAPYGWCPISTCGAKGVRRERRPDGDDKCANGHTYPSRLALVMKPAQPLSGRENTQPCKSCGKDDTVRRKNFKLQEQACQDRETIQERDSQIAVLIKQTTGTEKLLEKVCAERDELQRWKNRSLDWRKEKNTVLDDYTKVAKERDDLKKELRDFDERACAKLKEVVAMKDSQIEKLQSQHDMFRDEFLRIKACPGADSEIKGLCDRAVKDIERVVPLVAEAESQKLENAEIRRERDSLQEKLDEALKAIEHSERRSAQRLLALEAALKKLNLAHIKYQDYDELIKVIEGLPYMAPVYTGTLPAPPGYAETLLTVPNVCSAGTNLSDPKDIDKAFQTLYGCPPKEDEQARRCELCGATPRAIRPDASATRYYGCRTPGCENYSASLSLQSWNLLMASQRKVKEDSAKPMSAPTWPRYTQRQGPEMEIGGEQLDPGKAIQDAQVKSTCGGCAHFHDAPGLETWCDMKDKECVESVTPACKAYIKKEDK